MPILPTMDQTAHAHTQPAKVVLEVQRKLAAILAGDVAGYSRLTGVDEEGR